MKIAKADLVPTEANLRGDYASFAELEAACEAFTTRVNARIHRESARVDCGSKGTQVWTCMP